MLGAVYLDGGMVAAEKVVWLLLEVEIDRVAGQPGEVDYKSRLQELVQARYQVTPDYRALGATGPDHARSFTVEVVVGGEVLGKGSGKSKKAAETQAARIALERLSGQSDR